MKNEPRFSKKINATQAASVRNATTIQGLFETIDILTEVIEEVLCNDAQRVEFKQNLFLKQVSKTISLTEAAKGMGNLQGYQFFTKQLREMAIHAHAHACRYQFDNLLRASSLGLEVIEGGDNGDGEEENPI